MVHWRANNVKQLKIMIPSAGRTLYSGADRGLKIMGGIRKNADITYEPKQDTKFVAVALDYNNKEITDYAIVNVTKEDIKEEKKEKNTLKHLEDKKRITEERYKKYIQEEEHRMGGWNPKTREYKKSERKVEQLKIRMDREIRKIDEEIRKLRH
jgi:hypothetical protein